MRIGKPLSPLIDRCPGKSNCILKREKYYKLNIFNKLKITGQHFSQGSNMRHYKCIHTYIFTHTYTYYAYTHIYTYMSSFLLVFHLSLQPVSIEIQNRLVELVTDHQVLSFMCYAIYCSSKISSLVIHVEINLYGLKNE